MTLFHSLISMRLWWAMVSVGALFLTASAQLRFDPPSLEANQPMLNLRGTTGERYTLESSSDLDHWDFLYSGVASNGQLGFRDASIFNFPRKFYRAYSGSPSNSTGRVVVPILDSSKSASTLATPFSSRCDLALGNTALITLHVRSNIMTQAEIVALTRVAGITGLPFARGFLMAAQIDAADPAVLPATELIFTFGKDAVKDRRQVVSFACDADGSHFRLIPDRVTPSSATLAPTRPGVYGCALATQSELDQLAQSARNPPPPIRAASAQLASLSADENNSFLLASRLCFPTRVQAAIAIRNQLRSEVDGIAQRMALARAALRQSQPEGAADDVPPVDDIGEETCAFYENRIRPLFPRVADNCSLLNVLAGITLGMARQILLLGYEDCSPQGLLGDIPFCEGARACFKEIKQCCEDKPEERERLAPEIVGILRQQELLGLGDRPGCVTPAEVQQALEDCANYDWAGTMSFTEKGGFLKAIGGAGITAGVRYIVWDGAVTGQSLNGATLTLSGPLGFVENISGVIPLPCCGPYITVDNAISKTNLSLMLDVSIRVAGADASYTLKYAGLKQGAGQESKFGIQYLDCETCEEFTYFEAGSFAPPLEHVHGFSQGGAVAEGDRVQGTLELRGDYQGQPTEVKFTWNLVRTRRNGN